MNIETGLSLGSNTGDRLAHLVEARNRIAALPDTELLAQSPVYETEPVGVKPEYADIKFLNVVLIVSSPLTVHQWFDELHSIEDDLGRHRSLDRYAPRPIDIDIIYAGDTHIQSGGLFIPHPHWTERRFVLQPLADVRPELVLPGEPRSVQQVLASLTDAKDVTLLTQDW